MTPRKTSDIRTSFLDFFQKREHRLVPSSPVIPFDDPSILFTNAGMNQFKDVFTGKRKIDYRRATSAQKCLRAGGKHNDLDNVGFTARHHTFFEMLGNFSFGDYFKEEAIEYAWEWILKELKLPIERLWVTVYETDEEAFRLWGKVAPQLKDGRILRFGKKDNFWSMGEVGPCGPCSEIHFDRGEKFGTGPDDVVNGNTDRFIEIWNLVFMQYDQKQEGTMAELPRPSVDTGAGLERIASVVQQTETNYGIDLFQNLVRAISEVTGSEYASNKPSHHVVADHLRALSFSIADGAGISNEGRGYVLRRILRRAARHGRLLGASGPFMHKLVPVLTREMAGAYPELKEKESHVVKVIQAEEEAFGRTLETGLELFEKVAKKVRASGSKVVPGDEVFRLYDTYGFPYDLTEIIASEHELTLDLGGFESAMRSQQERSRASSGFRSSAGALNELLPRLKGFAATAFVRSNLHTNSTVVFVEKQDEPNVVIALAETPFYVESGGQVSDTGVIRGESFEFRVNEMHKVQDVLLHLGHFIRGGPGDVKFGDKVSALVDEERRWDIMRNHTATHLLHAALRNILGPHVKQSGSYVGPDRLRFDFSHHQPLTSQENAEIERVVNGEILRAALVNTEVMDVEQAKKSGAMALFGEKYGETVRVVSVADFSKELCGGTHVANVAQIGPFFIVVETGIASGVRRIEAITGREAIDFMLKAKQFRKELSVQLNRPESELISAVEQLKTSYGELQKELKRTKAAQFSGGGKVVGEETTVGALKFVTHDFGTTDKETMTAWSDSMKGRADALVAVALGYENGKRVFIATASANALTTKVDVGALSKEILPLFGGRGGGKPTFAQGNVSDKTDSLEFFDRFRSLLKGKLEAANA